MTNIADLLSSNHARLQKTIHSRKSLPDYLNNLYGGQQPIKFSKKINTKVNVRVWLNTYHGVEEGIESRWHKDRDGYIDQYKKCLEEINSLIKSNNGTIFTYEDFRLQDKEKIEQLLYWMKSGLSGNEIKIRTATRELSKLKHASKANIEPSFDLSSIEDKTTPSTTELSEIYTYLNDLAKNNINLDTNNLDKIKNLFDEHVFLRTSILDCLAASENYTFLESLLDKQLKNKEYIQIVSHFSETSNNFKHDYKYMEMLENYYAKPENQQFRNFCMNYISESMACGIIHKWLLLKYFNFEPETIIEYLINNHSQNNNYFLGYFLNLIIQHQESDDKKENLLISTCKKHKFLLNKFPFLNEWMCNNHLQTTIDLVRSECKNDIDFYYSLLSERTISEKEILRKIKSNPKLLQEMINSIIKAIETTSQPNERLYKIISYACEQDKFEQIFKQTSHEKIILASDSFSNGYHDDIIILKKLMSEALAQQKYDIVYNLQNNIKNKSVYKKALIKLISEPTNSAMALESINLLNGFSKDIIDRDFILDVSENFFDKTRYYLNEDSYQTLGVFLTAKAIDLNINIAHKVFRVPNNTQQNILAQAYLQLTRNNYDLAIKSEFFAQAYHICLNLENMENFLNIIKNFKDDSLIDMLNNLVLTKKDSQTALLLLNSYSELVDLKKMPMLRKLANNKNSNTHEKIINELSTNNENYRRSKIDELKFKKAMKIINNILTNGATDEQLDSICDIIKIKNTKTNSSACSPFEKPYQMEIFNSIKVKCVFNQKHPNVNPNAEKIILAILQNTPANNDKILSHDLITHLLKNNFLHVISYLVRTQNNSMHKWCNNKEYQDILNMENNYCLPVLMGFKWVGLLKEYETIINDNSAEFIQSMLEFFESYNSIDDFPRLDKKFIAEMLNSPSLPGNFKQNLKDFLNTPVEIIDIVKQNKYNAAMSSYPKKSFLKNIIYFPAFVYSFCKNKILYSILPDKILRKFDADIDNIYRYTMDIKPASSEPRPGNRIPIASVIDNDHEFQHTPIALVVSDNEAPGNTPIATDVNDTTPSAPPMHNERSRNLVTFLANDLDTDKLLQNQQNLPQNTNNGLSQR